MEFTREQYLEKILNDLEKNKAKGKKTLVKIGERIDFNIAKYIKEYFENEENYLIEITNKCSSCKNKYDIIIYTIK